MFTFAENLFSKMNSIEHPGALLTRMLEERGISKRELAIRIGEYPQLLGDITLGKRKMNPSLSIRIGRELQIDEDMLMIQQAKYDLHREREGIKSKIKIKPNNR